MKTKNKKQINVEIFQSMLPDKKANARKIMKKCASNDIDLNDLSSCHDLSKFGRRLFDNLRKTYRGHENDFNCLCN